MGKNYRKAKKRNQYARCLWLLDNLGCIKRTYLVDYFTKHPHDFALVKRLSKKNDGSPFYIMSVNRDMRNNYHHPDYSQEKSEQLIYNIESTFFTPYIRHKKRRPFSPVSLYDFLSFDEDYEWIRTPNGFLALKKHF